MQTAEKSQQEQLKDFLFKVQRDKDKNEQKKGLLNGDDQERKNILNLKIVCCVDISGSISSDQYNSFMSQIRLVKGLSRVMVIETDTDISCIYNYDIADQRDVVRLRGGGGTDFEIAFREACKMKPDAIVFLTDGDDSGNLKKPKDIPVAWVTTEYGHAPYSWGKEIGRVDK